MREDKDMAYKKIIPYINAENEISSNIVQLAVEYALEGADELFLYNYCIDETSKEEFFQLCRETARQIDIPIFIGISIKRFEDIKKALYTGASYVVIKVGDLAEDIAVQEGIKRFGAKKFYIELDSRGNFSAIGQIKKWEDLEIKGVILKHIIVSESLKRALEQCKLPVIIRDSLVRNDLETIIKLPNAEGVSTNYFAHKNLMRAKISLKEKEIEVNTYESMQSFSEFKLNQDGLIPVITQDYKTNEVLMLAYMNEEAFEKTIATGKMTYFSRSRQNLWIKGETSGHYQYVKSLTIDCDKDTILAKVHQLGAACHTGNPTCFFTDLVKKEYEQKNLLTVLNDVYGVIIDRKEHPKEGSYTNYLFEKGIDKILKKCGEEAAEIIIAAKNPDREELKYEISDFLYHMMVLMAECGLDWTDIIKELAHRK